MHLILLRHGESEWNLSNRFTGWKDVSLTKNGIKEANYAGEQLSKTNIIIKSIHTSLLNRATQTANIVADIIQFPIENIKHDWRLNERHYGALQGLNKAETAEKYGEEQVHIWRRSYDIAPPLLSEEDIRHPKFEKKFKDISESLPIGESLKDVIKRLNPFWKMYLEHIANCEGNHLIVAHSNSLRAIIKILDQLNAEQIVDINIPTGVPLVYKLSDKLDVKSKRYLIDDDILEKKKEAIKKQGTKNG
tara:strand:- start:2136 stop:2879 length:744 start_codon:yes stop_codon:yes gene_type:complete